MGEALGRHHWTRRRGRGGGTIWGENRTLPILRSDCRSRLCVDIAVLKDVANDDEEFRDLLLL